MQELPAANLNALWILLETLNRIAAEAAENEMDARALAAALAPTLAWHPPPPKTLSQVPCLSQPPPPPDCLRSTPFTCACVHADY